MMIKKLKIPENAKTSILAPKKKIVWVYKKLTKVIVKSRHRALMLLIIKQNVYI